MKRTFIFSILLICLQIQVYANPQIKALQQQADSLSLLIAQQRAEVETLKKVKAKKLNKEIQHNEDLLQSINDQIALLETEKTPEQPISKVVEEPIIEDEFVEEQEIKESAPTIIPTKETAKEIAQTEPQEQVAEKQPTSEQAEEDDDNDNVWIDIIAVICGVLFIFFIVRYNVRKWWRCPNCGHWFCMESQGDVRVYDRNNDQSIRRRGVKRRRVCSHCGEYTETIEWSNLKG